MVAFVVFEFFALISDSHVMGLLVDQDFMGSYFMGLHADGDFMGLRTDFMGLRADSPSWACTLWACGWTITA